MSAVSLSMQKYTLCKAVVLCSAEWGVCADRVAVVATHRHSGEIVAFLIAVTQSRRDVIGALFSSQGPQFMTSRKIRMKHANVKKYHLVVTANNKVSFKTARVEVDVKGQ